MLSMLNSHNNVSPKDNKRFPIFPYKKKNCTKVSRSSRHCVNAALELNNHKFFNLYFIVVTLLWNVYSYNMVDLINEKLDKKQLQL